MTDTQLAVTAIGCLIAGWGLVALAAARTWRRSRTTSTSARQRGR